MDVHEEADYANDRLILTEDGRSGIAVTPDGDIVSLFSGVSRDARMEKLIPMAIAAGGRKLDCYVVTGKNSLADLYSRFGFKVVNKIPFNEEYAPADFAAWKEANPGLTPKYVATMIYTGDTDSSVIGYNRDSEADIYNAPVVEDYGEALAMRDEVLANELAGQERESDDAVSLPAEIYYGWLFSRANQRIASAAEGTPEYNDAVAERGRILNDYVNDGFMLRKSAKDHPTTAGNKSARKFLASEWGRMAAENPSVRFVREQAKQGEAQTPAEAERLFAERMYDDMKNRVVGESTYSYNGKDMKLSYVDGYPTYSVKGGRSNVPLHVVAEGTPVSGYYEKSAAIDTFDKYVAASQECIRIAKDVSGGGSLSAEDKKRQTLIKEKMKSFRKAHKDLFSDAAAVKAMDVKKSKERVRSAARNQNVDSGEFERLKAEAYGAEQRLSSLMDEYDILADEKDRIKSEIMALKHRDRTDSENARLDELRNSEAENAKALTNKEKEISKADEAFYDARRKYVRAGGENIPRPQIVSPEGIMEAGVRMRRERIERLASSTPVVSDGREYIGKYALDNRSAAAYINSSLRGDYVNRDTGNTIRITRKGAFKVTRHDSDNEAHLKSIALIPKLIENAVFIAEEPNAKAVTGFDSYRYYVSGLNMDGKDYTVKMVIGTRNGETYYDHSLTEMEKSGLIARIDELSSSFTDDNAALPDVKDRRLVSILQADSPKYAMGASAPRRATIREVQVLTDAVQRIFPRSMRSKVHVLSGERFMEQLATRIGVGEIINDSGDVAGFTDSDGSVYINADEARIDTPLHEIGIHRLIEVAEQMGEKELYAGIIRYGRTAPESIKQYVRDKYGMDESDPLFYEEVAAAAFGIENEQGLEQFLTDETSKSWFARLREWLSGLWNRLRGKTEYADHSFYQALGDMSHEEIGRRLFDMATSGKQVFESDRVRADFLSEVGKARLHVAGDTGLMTDEERSIVERAKVEGTYMKAPNGNPTNLSERQWVQVRTNAFKEWFGNWEKTARIERLRNSNPVDVTYKGEYTLNRDNAKQWMLDNLRVKYINKDTGEVIELSRIGANKVTSHGERDAAHLKSIVAIPQLIENSIFIEELQNEKSNDKYDSYRYYVCGLRIDGENYTAKIVIGVKGDSKYYDHRLTEIEKGTLIDNLNGMAKSVAANQSSNNSDVKDTKLLSILKTNSSKVVDENGEPRVVYHGSPNEFSEFDTSRIGSSTGTSDGRGFYFTTSRDYADGYASAGGTLYEVFLDVRNPLSYDGKTITKAQLREIFRRADKAEYEREGEHYLLSNYADYTRTGIEKAVSEAADSEYEYADNDIELVNSIISGSGDFDLIMNAVKEVTGKSSMVAPKENGDIHYIVTSPNQIKSATGNTGAFSPESNDIRYQRVLDECADAAAQQHRPSGSYEDGDDMINGELTNKGRVRLQRVNESAQKASDALTGSPEVASPAQWLEWFAQKGVIDTKKRGDGEWLYQWLARKSALEKVSKDDVIKKINDHSLNNNPFGRRVRSALSKKRIGNMPADKVSPRRIYQWLVDSMAPLERMQDEARRRGVRITDSSNAYVRQNLETSAVQGDMEAFSAGTEVYCFQRDFLMRP